MIILFSSHPLLPGNLLTRRLHTSGCACVFRTSADISQPLESTWDCLKPHPKHWRWPRPPQKFCEFEGKKGNLNKETRRASSSSLDFSQSSLSVSFLGYQIWLLCYLLSSKPLISFSSAFNRQNLSFPKVFTNTSMS